MVISSEHGRSVSILGITGSVGQSAKDVLLNGLAKFKVNTVSAANNVKKLAKDAIDLKAECAVIAEETLYNELKSYLSGTNIKVKAGKSGLIEAVSNKVDIVLCAISGSVALEPTIAAIEAGSNIALANKECLVCAGDIINKLAAKSGSKIIPVDSEHSAIFQLFNEKQKEKIARIILTASGGPFRTYSKEQLANVTLEQALKHPNWTMGAKITIDSATMMNKALEVIEAKCLFDLENNQIEVLVHPQSVVHGVVEYKDGSFLAHLGNPDMRTPISYALAWPKRMEIQYQPLKLEKINNLSFEQVDSSKFPAIELAYQALNEGGIKPTIFNVANEIAVEAFLKGNIKFINIVEIVEKMLNDIENKNISTVSDVIDAITNIRQANKLRSS